jgi:hypothetical protein
MPFLGIIALPRILETPAMWQKIQNGMPAAAERGRLWRAADMDLPCSTLQKLNLNTLKRSGSCLPHAQTCCRTSSMNIAFPPSSGLQDLLTNYALGVQGQTVGNAGCG